MKRLMVSLFLLGAASVPAHALDPGVPVIKIQSGDAAYRVNVLEEQVRQLNGRIEELNFQLLEMQDLIRRMQEDNDFRFQQIEEKQGSLDVQSDDGVSSEDSKTATLGKQQPSEPELAEAGSGGENTPQETVKLPRTIDGVEIYQGPSGVETDNNNSLGTIEFDQNGNIIDSTIGKPLDLAAGLGTQQPASVLPKDAETLFSLGYDHVQTGRYEDAERALLAFSDGFSGHPRMPEARFWLGESYLGRAQYQKAAKVYLDAHKNWPNSKFGPQSLLKLGVSVAGLNQRELACATFAEVLQKYPNSSRAVRRNVAYEQRAAQCALN